MGSGRKIVKVEKGCIRTYPLDRYTKASSREISLTGRESSLDGTTVMKGSIVTARKTERARKLMIGLVSKTSNVWADTSLLGYLNKIDSKEKVNIGPDSPTMYTLAIFPEAYQSVTLHLFSVPQLVPSTCQHQH